MEVKEYEDKYEEMKNFIFRKTKLGYDYAIQAVEGADFRAIRRMRNGESPYSRLAYEELKIEYDKIKNGSWSK